MKRKILKQLVALFVDETVDPAYIRATSGPNNPVKHHLYVLENNISNDQKLRARHQLENCMLFEKIDQADLTTITKYQKKIKRIISSKMKSQFYRVMKRLDKMASGRDRYELFKHIAYLLRDNYQDSQSEIEMHQVCDIFLWILCVNKIHIPKAIIQQYVSRFRKQESIAEMRNSQWDCNIKSDDNILTNDAYFNDNSIDSMNTEVCEILTKVTKNIIFDQFIKGLYNRQIFSPFWILPFQLIKKLFSRFFKLPEWIQIIIVILLLSVLAATYYNEPISDMYSKIKVNIVG